jgi:hypothetical protein
MMMSHTHKATVKDKAELEKHAKDTGAGLLHFPKQLPTMNITNIAGVFGFLNFLAPKDQPEKEKGCTDHVNTLPSQPHSPQDRKSPDEDATTQFHEDVTRKLAPYAWFSGVLATANMKGSNNHESANSLRWEGRQSAMPEPNEWNEKMVSVLERDTILLQGGTGFNAHLVPDHSQLDTARCSHTHM